MKTIEINNSSSLRRIIEHTAALAGVGRLKSRLQARKPAPHGLVHGLFEWQKNANLQCRPKAGCRLESPPHENGQLQGTA
jgi:hypothetical protein